MLHNLNLIERQKAASPLRKSFYFACHVNSLTALSRCPCGWIVSRKNLQKGASCFLTAQTWSPPSSQCLWWYSHSVSKVSFYSIFLFWFRISLMNYSPLSARQSLIQNWCYRRNKSPDSDSAWRPHLHLWRVPSAGEVQLLIFWEPWTLLVCPVPQTTSPVAPETHLKREYQRFHGWPQQGWGILPSEKTLSSRGRLSGVLLCSEGHSNWFYKGSRAQTP